jgi:hypothetical protein
MYPPPVEQSGSSSHTSGPRGALCTSERAFVRYRTVEEQIGGTPVLEDVPPSK